VKNVILNEAKRSEESRNLILTSLDWILRF